MSESEAKPGGGPLDEAAEVVASMTHADVVLLVVQRGGGPADWTLQAKVTSNIPAAKRELPRLLRDLAGQIERYEL